MGRLAENLAALSQQRASADKSNKQALDAIISLAQERAIDTAGQLGAPTPATPAVARRLGGRNGNAPAKGIPGGKLTTIESHGQRFTVAAGASAAFKHFLDEIGNRGYKFHSNGGYVDRDIRGRPGVKSQHAYGRAIDINAETNPMLEGKLQTDMPSWVPETARKYGLSWGGDWQSRKDPMHFEYDA